MRDLKLAGNERVLDFGSDITPANNPYELGLERLVDLDKDEFIGKSALEAIHANGCSRKVMGALMDGAAFEKNNEHRWPVLRDDQRVGEVTSAVFSPRLGTNIGFAMMDIDFADTGRAFTVDTAEGLRALEHTTLPFIDPEKKIPRQPLR